MISFFLSFFTLQPKLSKIWMVIFTSEISGTLYNFETFPFKIVAAKMGKVAFLEPDTSISPRKSGTPFNYVVIHLIHLFIKILYSFYVTYYEELT